MANTLITIKKSTSTVSPASLASGELAYSYASNIAFIGTSDGTSVLSIGGKYFTDRTNSAYTTASLAFDKANTGSMDYAYVNTATQAANTWANGVGVAANSYAAAVGAAANSYMITVQNGSNTAVGLGANTWANSVGVAANAFTSATIAGANAAVGLGANTWANSVGVAANTYAAAVGAAANSYMITVQNGSNTAVGTGANNYALATFVKLTSATNQTITSDLSVVGNLYLSGNTVFSNVSTMVISDPLLYLAGNNYTSDLVDIGFIANYVNATSANVHTGIFRDATTKEYYVFHEYNKEPENNVIDPNGNNFTIAVLNATLRTSNLILGGANAILTIASIGPGANAWSNSVGVSANTWANSVGVAANTYASAVGVAANTYAATVGAAANTNAANATYLSTGTVPSARISGSYTGITGLGTVTAGTWNADVITVPYGGTGRNTFANNGVLFGNTTSGIRVTAAGTEGQVLQANADGTPLFGNIDGGTF